MAMMARMRSLAPWFILTVGGLFVLFMVLSDSRISDVLQQQQNNIGSVNGEDITYQEFSNLLEQYRQFQTQQTGQEIPESQMEAFRDNVWETLVNQKLLQMKIKELGLTVTDEEVKDMLLGPNPPASVTQYFIDSTGTFNRSAYESAIFNPQNKEAVLQVEEQVRAELLQQKLRNQINASVLVSEDDIKQRYIDQNIRMNANYVLVDANTIPDADISFNDNDIENYYKKNKEEYKVEPQRKLKYVLFRKEATQGDSASVEKNLSQIVAKLATDTASFKTYVDIYSEQPFKKDTLSISQISPGAQDAIVNSKKGEIVGPVLTEEGYAVFKIIDNFKSKDEVVKASHILVEADPANPNSDARAMEIFNRVTSGKESFAAVAKEVSKDPGSGSRGGDLGWFGRNQMVPEFENAAFSGKIGVVQKPVKSQFGWHIIKTTGKSDNKYVVEKIVNKIEPSPTTIDQVFQNAGDFAYLADKDDFEKTAGELGYDIVETTSFTEKAKAVPGLGSSRAIIVFTFENSVGSVGPVFQVPSGYAVCMVSSIDKGGYKPLEDLKDQITSLVKREKKKEKALEIAQKIYDKVKTSSDLSLATSVYPAAKIDTADNFTTAGVVPKLGREFAFAQKAYLTEVNTISKPFSGNRGSFIIKVTKKDMFDQTSYSIQKNTIRDNILNQKKNTMFNNWLTQVKEESSIEDLRHLFYR
ncbi:MAG: hypothetical protein CVV23_15290 [Ignavibacteriae bacterium HGW-Ignavibacteriae-2]|jgi:parvulin-like peptidyl-prolyl isomerase|nr:MAG: hypothetical protein CVV23_15290 [Ignavibacteriae bacterium HGW-Ignavibacteriae-2]